MIDYRDDLDDPYHESDCTPLAWYESLVLHLIGGGALAALIGLFYWINHRS